MILVDDHLLAARFSDADLGAAADRLATTCAWWWRLMVTEARLGTATGAFDHLPRSILVPERRDLLPAMARVGARFRLSVMAAEALVAAEALAADIVVGKDTPRLREACRVRGVTYLVQT